MQSAIQQMVKLQTINFIRNVGKKKPQSICLYSAYRGTIIIYSVVVANCGMSVGIIITFSSCRSRDQTTDPWLTKPEIYLYTTGDSLNNKHIIYVYQESHRTASNSDLASSSSSKLRHVCRHHHHSVLITSQAREKQRQQLCQNSSQAGLGQDSYSTYTLTVKIFRWQKNQPLLIYSSRCSSDLQKTKTKIIFQFSQGLFQKIPFSYFFLHKSWIWRTLGHVM